MSLKIKTFPAWINRLFCWLQKHDFKGKYRIYKLGSNCFLKHFLIKHNYSGKAFFVPWDQWCFWLEKGPENYYPDDIQPLAERISALPSNCCLIDLGADIGVVTAQLKQQAKNITLAICLEPNPNAYEILKLNADSFDFVAINQAISNYQGHAQLNFQEHYGSDHEGYITPSTHGKTSVTTLDYLYQNYQLFQFSVIILKIDVEGQEIACLEGAKHLLKSTPQIMILIEIHPDVLKREKINADAILTAAEQYRKFDWYVPSLNHLQIDRSQSFFKQLPVKQYDVIGLTKTDN